MISLVVGLAITSCHCGRNLVEYVASLCRRPVFVCIGMQEKDESWKREFTMLPHGVCHQIVPFNKPFDATRWSDATASLADNWNYPHDGFSATSWEKVANDEMWNAKISSAFFLYQQGVASDSQSQLVSSQTRTPLLVKSYELYTKAVAQHKQYPIFWHKNLALAAEKLMHMEGHKYSQKEMCEQSIKHFERYLEVDSGDQDRASIEAAVNTLKGRLKVMDSLDKVSETTENMLKRNLP